MRVVGIHYSDPQSVQVIIEMRNDMEAVNAYGGLFKIPFHNVPVGIIHVYGHIEDIIKFFPVDLVKIIAQIVLPAAGKYIKYLLVVEVVEDTGILTVSITVHLCVDFIDADGFREWLPGNMGMIIEHSGNSLNGYTCQLADALESHL